MNCNGIRGKIDEIAKWLLTENIKVAVFQETKLGDKSKLADVPHFTLVRKDRKKDKGGGLAFLVHETIQFSLLDDYEDTHMEYLAINIGNLKIINIYIPPSSCCTTGYTPSITPILPTDDALILGDINAHDTLWYSSIQDTRGSTIAEEIGDSDFATLNSDTHTRLPKNGQPTSPDISLASLSILPYASWETHTTFGSDILPILISLDTNIGPVNRK